jgi:hypothetical protein
VIAITKDDVDQSGINAHHFITVASDVGLPVSPPRTLATTLGNGQPFRLRSFNEQEWQYTQDLGCISLTVLND